MGREGMLLPVWWMRKLRSGKVGNSACTSKLLTYKIYGLYPALESVPSLLLGTENSNIHWPCAQSITSE